MPDVPAPALIAGVGVDAAAVEIQVPGGVHLGVGACPVNRLARHLTLRQLMPLRPVQRLAAAGKRPAIHSVTFPSATAACVMSASVFVTARTALRAARRLARVASKS